MHPRFGLTLVVNHACNLRCTYCYTGEKLLRPLPLTLGHRAIDCAVRSLEPVTAGKTPGTLELSFFGGEPLVEAELILQLVEHARAATARHGLDLTLSMTTNGTLNSPAAWQVMLLPEMQLAVSHDGLPTVHDRHRISSDGQPSSQLVEATLARLVQADKEFRVVLVVRPDNVAQLPAGLEYLYERGVRRFDPALDLWTLWTRADGERLRRAIAQAADFWSAHLPECGVSWFDEQAARMAGVPISETARCGFGSGQIAVTPAGNLYPCERLIGADELGNPHRLSGDVFTSDDFLGYAPVPGTTAAECSQCKLQPICSTDCRCSNYIRTGDIDRPDGLLCLWDQACYQETRRILESRLLVIH